MDLTDTIEYQRREYCNDLPCPIQTLLNDAEGTPRYDALRKICQTDCIHTTYEFHHWLIQKGYLVIRPRPSDVG